MKRLAASAVVALALVGGAGEACKGVAAPSGADVEAGAAVVGDACSYIEGIDNSGVVRVVCATVAEVAQVVEFILTLRSMDGGVDAGAVACKPLPGSALCATSDERARGVLFISHVRQARLSRDAGAP